MATGMLPVEIELHRRVIACYDAILCGYERQGLTGTPALEDFVSLLVGVGLNVMAIDKDGKTRINVHNTKEDHT